jgi:hypothetical protein
LESGSEVVLFILPPASKKDFSRIDSFLITLRTSS